MAKIKQPKRAPGRLSGAEGKTIGENAHQFKPQKWQTEAYGFLDIGEVGYVANVTAETVADGILRVEQRFEIDDEGNPVDPDIPLGERDLTKKYEWREATYQPAIEHLESFEGRSGGGREIKRAGALHLYVGGEAHCVGVPDEEDDRIYYEFLGALELGLDDDKNMIRKGVRQQTEDGYDFGGDGDHPLADDSFYQRMHKPCPKISSDPDSPVKRVLMVCRELLWLTQMVEAQVKSRLSSAMLYVPDEISFGADDEYITGAGVGDDDGMDPVEEALIDHMTAPVDDRTSAAALAPLVMRGPAEYADKVKLIVLAAPITAETTLLRNEALVRVSQGLDAPPEIVSGKASSNHWSAVAIDKDFIVKHVAPLGRRLAEFLTVSYLRPQLDVDDLSREQQVNFRVVYDFSKLVSREDSGAGARAVYDRGPMSERALVRHNGFDPDVDMPDDTERSRRLIIEIVKAKPAIDARESIILLQELEIITLDAILERVPLSDPQPVDDSVEDEDGDGDPVEDSQTRDEPSDQDDPGEASVRQLRDKLQVCADGDFDRTLDRVASRVVNAAKKNADLRPKFQSIPKGSVLHECGMSGLATLNISAPELFESEFAYFSQQANKWICDALTPASGRVQAENDAAMIVADIVGDLVALAVTSFEGPFDPDRETGFRVPLTLIEQHLGVANGAFV